MYVDVHTHLIHPKFRGEEDAAAARAAAAGVSCVIVNGLEPDSNRAAIELCERHENLYPAIGIYPVDAGCAAIDHAAWDHPFEPPAVFDVDAEIDWIEANIQRVVAIGECGLDRYWVDDEATRKEQERVLERLCELSVRYDKALILHTRKAEKRTFEIVTAMNVERADFHCFGGRSKLAVRIADAGYYFSIPPVVERSDAFKSMARKLPLDRILTETDAPYMGPERGERNEPANVVRGVAAIAAAREQDEALVRDAIYVNCRRLFFYEDS